MIHWPMTPEQTAKVGLPIVPRSKVDPTRSAKQVSAMFMDIEGRYLDIKRRLKVLFDQRLTGLQREVNGEQSWLMCNNEGADLSLYQVNARTYVYDMTAAQLADLLQIVQTILDDALLDGGSQNLWALDYVAAEYERGTLEAFNNLSQQSPVYTSQTTLQQLLSSPAYQNQIASAYISTYSDWKGISDAARADLANVIADAIGRGINPRETASIVSKRLDVSMSRAKTIAQTEQVGALRQAQWNETDWAADRLGLKTGLLWLSALKPTTRWWHAAEHGKVKTTEWVREFYSRDGNKYHCYCGQIPVLLNDDGSIFNKGLAEKLAKEREQWLKPAA
ncbi:phage minor head protein [Klebsiella pneumoniae]|uniref:phage minor head protein n=1 Tax=Klebsiella pneumoniae complex TaxID=3390273 RepID=UPI0006671732|nr:MULTISPECIES: phage minor head protein [Klebsiella]DAI75989.1 MAG TPA: minor capsid component [Caudoviricetes sp.]EMB5598961.1 phage head morphogenesis protein [Klebsiella pneumoniae]MBM1100764.1 phage head morphogenesis protein [Klebsiella pneumoniae]MBR7250378.1 phage head morphogenesis protein [Klebsiella pneumoniae]MBZ4059932.1 phage head morphogenesis protein [Klebsiella pneumoniae]